MTWDLEALTKLNTQLNTYISDIQTNLSAIQSANTELQSVWNTSKATNYFNQMNDFSKKMSSGISLYEDISKKIKEKCSELFEID